MNDTMTYDIFLVSLLYSKYCTEYSNLKDGERWDVAFLVYDIFKASKYFKQENVDHDYDMLYVDIVLWLDSIDWSYHVACECGHWEQMPADMPRHKMQTWEWLKNSDMDVTAYYKCPDCGTTQRSEIIPDFDINYKTSKTTI